MRLSNNKLGDEGVVAIAEGLLKNSRMREL